MRRSIFATLRIGFLIFGLLASSAQAGDSAAGAGNYPRYLILQRDNKGQSTLVPAVPYAYGWFGAMPSSSSTWHRSYNGTILTWTYTPGH